jgi:hypothetical protein
MDRFILEPSADAEAQACPGWQPPAFEVISLCCEITAYAPDDEPLF